MAYGTVGNRLNDRLEKPSLLGCERRADGTADVDRTCAKLRSKQTTNRKPTIVVCTKFRDLCSKRQTFYMVK